MRGMECMIGTSEDQNQEVDNQGAVMVLGLNESRLPGLFLSQMVVVLPIPN